MKNLILAVFILRIWWINPADCGYSPGPHTGIATADNQKPCFTGPEEAILTYEKTEMFYQCVNIKWITKWKREWKR